MAEDHGAPKAGQLPRVWTRDRRETESERRRVRSWTVQNEMRDVLGRVSTGAAGRILDSANPRDIRTLQKAVSVAAQTIGEHSEHDEGAQVPRWKSRESACREI